MEILTSTASVSVELSPNGKIAKRKAKDRKIARILLLVNVVSHMLISRLRIRACSDVDGPEIICIPYPVGLSGC